MHYVCQFSTSSRNDNEEDANVFIKPTEIDHYNNDRWKSESKSPPFATGHVFVRHFQKVELRLDMIGQPFQNNIGECG